MAQISGERIFYMPTDYVVFDTETTGTSVTYDNIIEIAAIKISNTQISETFQTLVYPGRSIPPSATAVNHITNEMVINAPTIDVVLPKFLAFIEDLPLIGHNINVFDLNLIARYSDLSNGYIDTVLLARKCLKQLPDRSLTSICDYYGIDTSSAHRALVDCFNTNEVLHRMYNEFGDDLFVKPSHRRSPYYKTLENKNFCQDTQELRKLQTILKEIVADDVITEDEFLRLKNWIDQNEDLSGNYPYDEIYDAICKVLINGKINHKELTNVIDLFEQCIDPVNSNECHHIESLKNKHCCLTGDFNFGHKSDVNSFIISHGGLIEDTVKKATDILVVGAHGSQTWTNGNYGSKIKKALEYNSKYENVHIEIISEEDFFKGIV